MIDSPVKQLTAAATRAGLPTMFGPLTFEPADVTALESCGYGEDCQVVFGSDGLPLGVLYVEVFDSGDPEDEGLTVGLRGWKLNDEIAGV
jgi:hypothetical protein